MPNQRHVEIFSAGCPVCETLVARVHEIACRSCNVTVLDMNDPAIANRATSLGIASLPAVAIDGVVADCCAGRGPDEAALRAAGLGQSLD